MVQTTEITCSPSSSPPGEDKESSPLIGWSQAIAVFITAIVLMFYPVLFGGKTTVYGAANHASIIPTGAYYGSSAQSGFSLRCADPCTPALELEPWLKHMGWSYLTEHRVPLWNTDLACGMPFLANSCMQPLNPVNAIASLFTSNWGIDLFVLSRLLIAGMIALLTLRKLLPEPSAALVGAIAFMFAGDMLLCLNYPAISLTMFSPLIILGLELLVRRTSVTSFALFAASVGLSLLSSDPEGSFSLLVFSGFYSLVRVLCLKTWKARAKMLALICLGFGAGILISLPQILPFVEYVSVSFNTHDPAIRSTVPGLVYDADWQRGLLSYVFPGGWTDNCFARGFYGVTLAFLAILGTCAALLQLKTAKSDRTTIVMMLFLSAAFLAMLLKRFGSPLVQWFGALPIANLDSYPVINEPIMSLCIAILAAFGVASVQRMDIKPRHLIFALLSFCLLVGAAYACYRGCPATGLDAPRAMRHSLVIGAVSLGLTFVLCLSSFTISRIRRCLPVLLAVVIAGEVFYAFLVPTFYGKGGVVSRDTDAFRGAPYIDFLQQKTDRSARVIGLDSVLFPNWAAAFHILDVRAVDNLFPRRYPLFISTLLPSLKAEYWDYEKYPYMITGADANTYLPFEQLQRVCALTSAKYVLALNPLSTRTDLIAANVPLYLARTTLSNAPFAEIDGVKHPVLFQHPCLPVSANGFKFPILVPVDHPILQFDFVRNPDVHCPPRNQPIQATLLISSTDDNQAVIERTFINSEPKKQHATHYSVDLSRFAGKKVLATLFARPMPGQECAWEWVGWTRMCFQEPHNEQCIYDHEVKVYQLSDILPHAACFSSATVVADEQAALELLGSKRFSPMQSVVFIKSDIGSKSAQQLSALRSTSICKPATISKYASDDVEIDLPPSSQPSILLLTDNDYPGWRAFVDGKECSVLKANFCFRAVELPAGARHACFKYEPLSFTVGVAASALTVLALFFAGCISWFKCRSATSASLLPDQ